ncbi:hypothetical protein CFSAN002368_29594 [Clostridium botulinum A1 str. CFSAN002368]|nr:hypothetical protein CFSAN002368_29594 [Clostridium botulinum A1 str. CFSAN002368]
MKNKKDFYIVICKYFLFLLRIKDMSKILFAAYSTKNWILKKIYYSIIIFERGNLRINKILRQEVKVMDRNKKKFLSFF